MIQTSRGQTPDNLTVRDTDCLGSDPCPQQARQRIVLAYSGDADTTIGLRWLAGTSGAEIATITLDFGQRRDLEEVRDRALAFGASRAHVLDVREEFARDYLLRAMKADALYGGGRSLARAAGHVAIAAKLVEIADIEQTPLVAHGGVTSAPRIAAVIGSLKSSLEIVAPAREWKAGRVEPSATTEEAAPPAALCLDEAAVKPAAGAVREPAFVDITFQAGTPVAINGVGMPLLDLMGSLDFLAGKNGVGGGGAFETRAGPVLAAAHKDLQRRVVAAVHTDRFSRMVSEHYADLIESGAWFSVFRGALDAYIDKIEEPVSGVVRIRLFQGTFEVVQSQIHDSRQENDACSVVRPLRYRT
jgi:argininosuccinate synthase